MSEFGAIEKLRREHVLDRFDCGKEDLNRFLTRQAWNNQQAHSAQTYVLAKDLRVLGYYSATSHTGDPAGAACRGCVDPSRRCRVGAASDPSHLLLNEKDLLEIVEG